MLAGNFDFFQLMVADIGVVVHRANWKRLAGGCLQKRVDCQVLVFWSGTVHREVAGAGNQGAVSAGTGHLTQLFAVAQVAKRRSTAVGFRIQGWHGRSH